MANTSCERERIAAGSHPGELGLAYAPFDPAGGGQLLNNLNLAVPPERLGDRKLLLGKLDNVKRSIDASGNIAGLDRFERPGARHDRPRCGRSV